jgi:hypothetical protein
MQRRQFLKWATATALATGPLLYGSARAQQLPAEVAGVQLPRSRLAQRAADYARASCPDYLFNHCMRTYLFGSLHLARHKVAYRAEDAFIAAAFHDLGLLPAFESPQASFEIDGADTAEHWVRGQGASAGEADRIWHAVQMHDGAFALTQRQGPEAVLVAMGAGLDVYGPDPGEIEAPALREVLTAFPRLGFKQRFTELLVAHCERKPLSQHATWLEGVCRGHATHPAADDAVEQHIRAAAFSE